MKLRDKLYFIYILSIVIGHSLKWEMCDWQKQFVKHEIRVKNWA